MEEEPSLDIPSAWERIPLEMLRGVVMIIGASNVGKSTFARYLFSKLTENGLRSAYLDGDPGQSSLGPPTTLTLGYARDGQASYPPQGERLRRFVGSTSPRGHMLGMLVGAARLVEAAQQGKAEVVIYDTSGFVDLLRGGTALKLAKMDLIEPAAVFALQREDELEGFLRPLKRSRRFQIFRLRASAAARQRNTSERKVYRSEAYARHFQDSRLIELHWPDYAVFPGPHFQPDRLVGLNDQRGFNLALGIVLEVDRQARTVKLLTPLPSLEGVDLVQVGDLLVDPVSFQDRMIAR